MSSYFWPPVASGGSSSITLGTPASGLVLTGTVLTLGTSSTNTVGALTSADWNTFAGKQNALSFGNLSELTSSVLTISGGTGAVIGSGVTITVGQATTSTSGYLSSADWSTFNGKQPAGTYVKADGTVGLSADWNAGAHTITATTFSGALSGNATTSSSCSGNAATSSSCSGNAATATTAGACSGNAATATTASACSGNAATATTAGACSGNAATATTAGACSGNSATATKSTNIAGGSGGTIPYQSAADTTAMLANGTAGQVLTSAGTTAAPIWGTGVMVGAIEMFGAAAAPTGWLLCDGSSLDRTTYAGLFAVIGTTWGNVDGSHFNIPDLRGVYPKGAGTTNRAAGKGANGDYYTGAFGGYATDHFQGHYHVRLTAGSNFYGYIASGGSNAAPGGGSTLVGDNTTGAASADATDGTPRIGVTTEPQSIVVNFIIKY